MSIYGDKLAIRSWFYKVARFILLLHVKTIHQSLSNWAVIIEQDKAYRRYGYKIPLNNGAEYTKHPLYASDLEKIVAEVLPNIDRGLDWGGVT